MLIFFFLSLVQRGHEIAFRDFFFLLFQPPHYHPDSLSCDIPNILQIFIIQQSSHDPRSLYILSRVRHSYMQESAILPWVPPPPSHYKYYVTMRLGHYDKKPYFIIINTRWSCWITKLLTYWSNLQDIIFMSKKPRPYFLMVLRIARERGRNSTPLKTPPKSSIAELDIFPLTSPRTDFRLKRPQIHSELQQEVHEFTSFQTDRPTRYQFLTFFFLLPLPSISATPEATLTLFYSPVHGEGGKRIYGESNMSDARPVRPTQSATSWSQR